MIFFCLKSVSDIIDQFSNKKMGVNFFFGKKTTSAGVGSEGGMVKHHTFPHFFAPFPNYEILGKIGKYQGKLGNFRQN